MASLGMLDPTTVSLLWADPERASEVADMHSLLFEKPWTVEDMRKLLEHPTAMSLVATVREERGNMLAHKAGFVLAQLAGDEAEILSIGVLDEFQGRGLGHIMMDGVVRAAKNAGAGRVFLEVAKDNRPAHRLYSKLGFAEVGQRDDYYARAEGERVDALILAKDVAKSE